MNLEWQYSTPQAEGMDAEMLGDLDDFIKQKRYRLVNSVLVVRNGKIVFERYYNKYNENTRNQIKSIWKSILSLLTGICLDKGMIRSLDEPIGDYLPAFQRGVHPYHKAITIRHLLTMSSGIFWNGGVHYHCPMVEQMKRTRDWIAHVADVAMKDYPGSSYVYKEWDVLLLSAVIGNAFGNTSYELCEQLLYKPLGISSGRWAESPCGVSYTVMKGEEHSNLSARDLAKIGFLVLNNGIVEGQRIVSEHYIKEMLRPNDNNSSYGYLWWILENGYACKGFGGQEINILPKQNIVTVIQATPTPSSKTYGDIHKEILEKSVV
ncbi:serine hydrolase [Paenibacillus favisporus]|uniref:serine hydrolase domain-containing protein n=1 Tax=Paenibacillus favisporus TaxID=221028 RepID=UPI002DB6A3F8|nr:serine hydrolase [Paenibacillus favisporus]MEC0176893.1 serine hydrolase [Paenibacillus favisporus]